jgi:ferredoxin-like protein FixX
MSSLDKPLNEALKGKYGKCNECGDCLMITAMSMHWRKKHKEELESFMFTK